MAAVDELGYRPSGVARSLRMRRTRTLGLIVTDIQNPFFPELVQAADVAARALGYSILLGSAAYDEHRAMHYLDLMVDRRVDGMIIASSQVSQASWQWLLRSPVPVVVVNAEPAGLPVTVITGDNIGGAELAIRSLSGWAIAGSRIVAGSSSLHGGVRPASRVPPRLRRGRARPGATRRSSWATGCSRAASRRRRARRWRPDVTAIACHNDVTAIGVLRALRAAGRRVPGEVSVIGCDDIAAASWVSPTLTTVAQQKAEMGRLAVERLAARSTIRTSPRPPRRSACR